MEDLAIGARLKLKMRYGGAEGEVLGELMEMTRDGLGSWAGLDVQGTTLPALRHWTVSRSGAPGRLFCSQTPVEAEKQVQEEGQR